MKKLAFLSMTLLLALPMGQLQAQVKEKQAINETKKVIKSDKKDSKTQKKQLRKLSATTVNAKSKASFYASFGDVANLKWKSSVYYDEATFTIDGKEMTAYFDIVGMLVGTTSFKTFADVPSKGQKAIKNRYKGYNIGTVLFFNDNEFNDMDMILYGIQFGDEDNYFVTLTKGNSKIIVKVNTDGMVSFFKQL